MELRIISDMNRSYLIIETEDSIKAGYQQKMVLKNSLTGILQMEQRQVDDRFQYYYDITDKISLVEYMKRTRGTDKEVSFVFIEIIKIMESAGVFLLEQDHFILEPEYIYISVEDKTLWLCFYEYYRKDLREQLTGLAEFFMEKIDYNEEKAVTLTYRIYKRLREETCNFNVIKEIVSGCKEIECEHKRVIEPIEDRQEPVICYNDLSKRGNKEDSSIKIKDEVINYSIIILNILIVLILIKTRFLFYQYSSGVNIKHVLISGLCLAVFNMSLVYFNKRRLAIKQETMFMEYEDLEGTMVISINQEVCKLRAQGRGEDITVDKFPCILGADKQKADKVIKEPGISKQHAILEAIKGGIYIRDLKSTNGTFINGELLSEEKGCLLVEGNKVTLADVTYQFTKM
ncbi:DUF6382 domain-containing protein [[Clostridium] polysaccharolyticum]|uniref:FHA domain-containing protein n=1 Tax=[Clostridium] polysaccharolyticum TaxID=29364 RepID=A0A1I0DAH0_9FIRM|nr:DUF6382 domain-containing protein [[Clostridium] polysaccharolyticum]SET28985.1 FHA domain-containing protein [[Clostridium] polysaccharolyticum]